MITPTQDIALDRWDTLPLNLREALCAEANSDFIWKTSGDEHIPEEKIYEVAKVAGYVLMGFLHPEDVAQELKERLGIDIRTANDIEIALNKRIFTPLRTDIDKIYLPISKSEAPSIGISPKILQGADTTPVKPAPLPVNKMAAPVTSASAPAAVAPSPTRPAKPLPPPQKPATTSDIGWSKTQTSGPVIKLDVSNVPPAPPSSPSGQSPSQPLAQDKTTPQKGSGFITPGPMSEFERLNIAAKRSPLTGSTPTAAPASPSVAPTPANDPPPVMLHEDTSLKAGEKNAGFTLPKPGSNAEIKLAPGRPQAPTRSAVLELGGAGSSAPKPPATSDASHVVHYTEFKPSLSSVPTADSGPRNVSQITPPSVPKPPMPPKPQASPSNSSAVPIPRPPQPAQAQTTPAPAEKVIVKNFP